MKDIKLRLVYYFYIPNDEFNEMYELHFKCLEQYSNLFDESTFFIAIDDFDADKVRYVENRLINCGFNKNVKFNVIPNNESLREAKILKEEIVDKMRDLDGLTFFAHTKGVSTYTINPESNKIWVAAMYYFNLNYVEDVKKYLYEYHNNSYGFFRCFDSEFYQIKNRWMYCGTFMWLNCPKIHHYIETQNVVVPELFDKYFAEEFIGNVTPWTLSCSEGGWVTKNQNLYNDCKEVLNLFIDTEEKLNEFNNFYNSVCND